MELSRLNQEAASGGFFSYAAGVAAYMLDFYDVGALPDTPSLAVWVGTTAMVCHSFGDLPFRSPAVLVVWLLALVCAMGWIPVLAVKKK